jgi:hypothetical protein
VLKVILNVQALVAALCAHVSRSLFNKDRLVFALHLARHLPSNHCPAAAKARDAEWDHLVMDSATHTLATATASAQLENIPKWIPQPRRAAFAAVCRTHESIAAAMHADEAAWAAWQGSPDAEKLPESSKQLTELESALVVQALRPEALFAALQRLVAQELGAGAVQPGALELKALNAEVGPRVPILFINAPGSDPCQQLQAFAARCVYFSLVSVCFLLYGFVHWRRSSLGQGQCSWALWSSKLETRSSANGYRFPSSTHLAATRARNWSPLQQGVRVSFSTMPLFESLPFEMALK